MYNFILSGVQSTQSKDLFPLANDPSASLGINFFEE